MIDFDVVTGPSPAEKPAEPVLKPPVGPRPADAASRLAPGLECLLAILRFQNFITLAAQNLRDQRANTGLVFRDQDGLGASFRRLDLSRS